MLRAPCLSPDREWRGRGIHAAIKKGEGDQPMMNVSPIKTTKFNKRASKPASKRNLFGSLLVFCALLLAASALLLPAARAADAATNAAAAVTKAMAGATTNAP